VFRPGSSRQSVLPLLYKDEGELAETCTQTGVPCAIGRRDRHLQALEALKVLARPRHHADRKDCCCSMPSAWNGAR